MKIKINNMEGEMQKTELEARPGKRGGGGLSKNKLFSKKQNIVKMKIIRKRNNKWFVTK